MANRGRVVAEPDYDVVYNCPLPCLYLTSKPLPSICYLKYLSMMNIKNLKCILQIGCESLGIEKH